MFLVIDMTSMAREGPALATVTKQGLCLEPLIIHLTLISTPTYWIFQTDTSNLAQQALHQLCMTMLVFHPTQTTMDTKATMDIMVITSNHFILPTLFRLLTSITTMLHHFKEQELFRIISQLAPCHTTITHALSPVTIQADMSRCKPHTIKDLDM